MKTAKVAQVNGNVPARENGILRRTSANVEQETVLAHGETPDDDQGYDVPGILKAKDGGYYTGEVPLSRRELNKMLKTEPFKSILALLYAGGKIKGQLSCSVDCDHTFTIKKKGRGSRRTIRFACELRGNFKDSKP